MLILYWVGRPVPQLCMITTLVVNYLYENHADLLHDLRHPWLSQQHLQMHADAIHYKGAALNNCWSFIDGTVRPICRPQEYQRVVYNGHKRVHALKFQSVVTPNDLIANLFGPVEGRRHNSGMLAMSGLLPQLEQVSFSPTGEAMCIYGDPADPHRMHLQRPFARRQELAPAEQAFNQSMSKVRVCVEWVFGDIVNYFKFTDLKRTCKLVQVLLAKYTQPVLCFVVGCHVCTATTSLRFSTFNLQLWKSTLDRPWPLMK